MAGIVGLKRVPGGAGWGNVECFATGSSRPGYLGRLEGGSERGSAPAGRSRPDAERSAGLL